MEVKNRINDQKVFLESVFEPIREIGGSSGKIKVWMHCYIQRANTLDLPNRTPKACDVYVAEAYTAGREITETMR